MFHGFNFGRRRAGVVGSILLATSLCKVRDRKVREVMECSGKVRGKAVRPSTGPRIMFRAPMSTIVSKRSNVKRLVSRFTVRGTVRGTGGANIKFMSMEGSGRFNVTKCCTRVTSGRNLLNVTYAGSRTVVMPAFKQGTVLNSGPVTITVPTRPCPFLFSYSAAMIAEKGLRVCGGVKGPLPRN